MRQLGNRWLIGLTLAATAGGACTEEGSSNVNADEIATRLQAELEAGATLNAATAASVRPVRPVLKCVDKLSSTSYRAHFSYTNSSTSSIPIPVGFFNRFFPDPSNRGQPTTFAAGTHADVVQVTFSSSSFVAWVLGSGVAAATKTSALCPTGTGGGTGTGGAGTGGRGGGAGSGTGGVGSGGSGAGGAAVCPSSCDDHNPCTIDLCNASTAFKCSNVATRDGTACDDGNACTNLDTCLAGVCTAGPAKICTALDQCHVVGVCDSTTGACSNPPAAEGLACNDGNLCTAADTCRSGVCTGGTATVCTASDQCHSAGVCAPATGICSNPTLANGSTCNDGNACTTIDSCQAGVCTGGSPKVCTASDQCHVAGVCNTGTGACSNPAAANGVACSDGNGCTLADSCQAGVCVSGSPKTCVALDQCHTAGVCAPATGLCTNPNVADATPCNDGSLCTAVDLCQAGVCVGTGPKTCTALDQCHAVGVCVPATGLCSNPALADGTSCNDGNVCTTGDACQAGVCTPQVTLTASHCAGAACDQCSFDVGTDICSTSPDGCFNCVPSTDGCDTIADPTDRQLCEDAYGCFTNPANNCVVQGDVTTCWCGTNTATCQTDNTAPTMANGPCLDVITRAARLTAATYDSATVLLHFVDPDFPLGRAVNLVTCRANFCSAECGVH
jgi:hypothetical protein